MVNFRELFVKLSGLYKSSYVNWEPLRNSLLGRVNDVTQWIQDGCEQLAHATILILYSHFRNVAGKHDFVNADIYAKRCNFDYRTNLPSGCIYIIHNFGMLLTDEVWKNPRVIHTWDKKDEKQYGIPVATHQFNSETLDSFLRTLVDQKVPFDRLAVSVPPRSAWDSLLIIENEDYVDSSGTSTDYTVFTTLPKVNYNLPRDIFLAIGLLGATIVDPDQTVAIEPYAPRIQAVKKDELNKAVYGSDTDGTKTTTRARRKSFNSITKIDENKVLPNIPFQYMTPHGIEVPSKDTTKAKVWIYGRGSEDDIIPISSVGRCVDISEVQEYFRHLLRAGPN
jgi:hypothetical protein